MAPAPAQVPRAAPWQWLLALCAGLAQAASLALQSGHWDLVILDWWLPGQDGLLLKVREHEPRPVDFIRGGQVAA